MTLKLNGSSSGSVSIDAPASTTGGADITFKLPVADGTSGQALTTNASGQLAFATPGLFSSYAIITNELSAGTLGGATTANSWTTFELNTELADPSSIVSISSNQFTLAAGNYLVKWRISLHNCERAISRIYDVTNSAVRQYSTAQYGIYTASFCPGVARLTPSGTTAYKIEYYADNTDSQTYGKGYDAPDDVAVTINAMVEIYKEA
tara:strand:+ start:1156 stop:1776 length:621 start_codon:yes stop_codon:yes gene_type:complete